MLSTRAYKMRVQIPELKSLLVRCKWSVFMPDIVCLSHFRSAKHEALMLVVCAGPAAFKHEGIRSSICQYTFQLLHALIMGQNIHSMSSTGAADEDDFALMNWNFQNIGSRSDSNILAK